MSEFSGAWGSDWIYDIFSTTKEYMQVTVVFSIWIKVYLKLS